MKPMSVLAVCAASVAILASAACKKDEPASETNTTSAPITPDQPVVTPQTPPATPPTTDVNGAPQQTTNGTTTGTPSQSKAKGPTPTGGTDLIDRGNTDMNPNQITPPDQTQNLPNQAPNQTNNGQALPNNQQPNHSTPLGDGKSGTYTDNKGTHGGKATWGTGPQKNTKMDQPTP